MWYGRPKIFAVQAMGRYVRAHMAHAAAAYLAVSKTLAERFAVAGFLLTALSLTVLVVSTPHDSDLFGNYALIRIYKTTVCTGDHKSFRPRETEALESGHVCAANG